MTRKLEARNNDTARWSYGAEVGQKHSTTAEHVAGSWRDAERRRGGADPAATPSVSAVPAPTCWPVPQRGSKAVAVDVDAVGRAVEAAADRAEAGRRPRDAVRGREASVGADPDVGSDAAVAEVPGPVEPMLPRAVAVVAVVVGGAVAVDMGWFGRSRFAEVEANGKQTPVGRMLGSSGDQCCSRMCGLAGLRDGRWGGLAGPTDHKPPPDAHEPRPETPSGTVCFRFASVPGYDRGQKPFFCNPRGGRILPARTI